ncbi:MAG: DUF4097 domain-containing protein [Tannerellaceae bacterium]|nr:DUF4097 domain-containing protein [Tannerellaceae bacterium]
MNTTYKHRPSLFIMVYMLVLSVCGTIHAEEYDSIDASRSKEISQTYQVNKSDQLIVDNRYGNITVNYWNKNMLSIRVVVESRARNEQKAQEAINRVNITMKQQGSKVYASTSFQSSGRNSGNDNLTIHYHIDAPSGFNLELQQRYGDIYLPDKNEGNCTLNIQYGNIRAGNFSKDLTIEGKYSNLSLDNIKKLKLDASYCGDVRIQNGEELHIDARYSNFQTGIFNKIYIGLKYGNLKIKEVGDLDIDTKYSDITIEKLINRLYVRDQSYTGITVREVDKSFSEITSSARYGNLNLYLPEKTAFQIEADNMKYGNLNMHGFNNTSTQITNGSHTYSINGGGKAKIKFNGNNYSNLTIRRY